MAEIFQKAGYTVFGLPAMSLLSREAGFARGFMEYRLDGLRADKGHYSQKYYRPSSETLAITKSWLEQASQPFFIWIHYFGIHSLPIETLDLPDQYRRSYSEYAQFYDGKVVQADEQFLAPLIDYMEVLGLLDQTILVLWSDHGDHLWSIEHRDRRQFSGHNWGLTEEVMRILLVIRAPWLLPRGKKETEVCRSIDILPMLLEMTRLTPDLDQCEGRSLISSASQADPPVIYMENLPQSFVGLRHGKYKLVLAKPEMAPKGPIAKRIQVLKHTAKVLLPSRWRRQRNNQPRWEARGEPNEIFDRLLVSGNCELYDLAADPNEKHNIAKNNPQLVSEHKEILRAITTQAVSPRSGYTIAEEEALTEHLRSLGYL
jgi:arylsulfatase A-like enzyme